MPLIVEDGTGLANANSFISLADADAYFAARGNAAWDALDAVDDKTPALIRAADYMEQVYRDRWAGYRVTSTQALSWPRYEVPMKDFACFAYYPSDAVPVQVANACAELALRATTAALTVDVGRLKSRVKVGPIETEYVNGSSAQVRYSAVDNMLSAFFGGGGPMSIKVVRS